MYRIFCEQEALTRRTMPRTLIPDEIFSPDHVLLLRLLLLLSRKPHFWPEAAAELEPL
jgi:hypothetical protein